MLGMVFEEERWLKFSAVPKVPLLIEVRTVPLLAKKMEKSPPQKAGRYKGERELTMAGWRDRLGNSSPSEGV
jgi:hypothetical protein